MPRLVFLKMKKKLAVVKFWGCFCWVVGTYDWQIFQADCCRRNSSNHRGHQFPLSRQENRKIRILNAFSRKKIWWSSSLACHCMLQVTWPTRDINLLPGSLAITMMKYKGFVRWPALQSLGLRMGDGRLDNNEDESGSRPIEVWEPPGYSST
jgi:hypothetical protein